MDRYVERADRALKKRIVDRNSRMSAIFQAWRESGVESALQQKARESLASVVECDPGQVERYYRCRPNRPIFPEHETRDATGQVQRYDREALAAIVDRCNRRIMDTGDLAAMSAGHTPDFEQKSKGMQMPDLVGFTGPFRMGLIGDQQPKWCIFADEHIFNDEYSRVQKMPRRSPEVWLAPKMSDRVMDPIAVLGSEPPRLDTGVGRFSRSSRRLDTARYMNVARYSMGSFPGGSNTFTQKYSAEGGQMDQETIQNVVQAVMQGIAATPQWQYLTDQMTASQNPIPESADTGPTPSPAAAVVDPSNPTGSPADPSAIPSAAPAASGDPAPAAAKPPGDAPPAAPAAPPGDAAPAGGDPTEKKPPANPDSPPAAKTDVGPKSEGTDESGATPEELASMPDDEKAEYSKLSPSHQYGYMQARRRHCKSGGGDGGSMQYSNPVDRARYSRMEGELVSLRGENAALRADRTYRDRYSKLSELNQIHEFDINEEATECRGLTDDQFTKHLDRIVTRYQRRDPNGGMPTLVLPDLERPSPVVQDQKVERYSRRAVEISTESGGTIQWNEAYAKAKAEIDKT